MPANTPKYSFPYLLGSDNNNTIDSGFENLATTLETFISTNATGRLFHLAGSDDTSTAQTTTSTTYVNRTDCQVTFTTGPSGIFIVNFTASVSNSTTGITRAGIDLTGAVTLGAGGSPNIVKEGTGRIGAGFTKLFVGTPNTSCTVTLAMSTSAGTGTVHDANIQVVKFG